MDLLKYPIGLFQKPDKITALHCKEWIKIIEDFPLKVAFETSHLNAKELQYTYRSGGWNIKQVIMHCVDSHTNSSIRFKLALTENNPTIKPYNETAWGTLQDTLNYPLTDALSLLNNIHKRWVILLNSMLETDFNKTFIHPEDNETVTLKENLGIYAWHCQHHLQHIINAKKRHN